MKYSICLILIFLCLLGCSTAPSSSKVPSLDETLKQVAEKIEERLASETRIALINVSSPSVQFSEYVLTYLESVFVNNGKLVVVDRSNLDRIRQEQGFQLSGNVSDESASAIGKMLGAGAIITGTLINIGDSYRLTLKAINVETATVAASHPADISNDNRVKVLLSSRNAMTSSAGIQVTAIPQTTVATNQPAATYKIGDTGPAGGLIFYDKGNSVGGWRYLEAAPASAEVSAVTFSPSGHNDLVGERKVGEGKENTIKFIKLFQQRGGGINTAPWLCNELSINGFNDWYLPSLDELLYMYNNLHVKGLGGFKNVRYWSSYVNGWWYTFCVDFSDGSENSPFSDYKYNVRAIRQF